MSGPGDVTDPASGVDQAVKRVTDALDALDAALEQRLENEHKGGALTEQVHVFNVDRSRLASELDEARARARELETSNREAIRRIDEAMSAIRAVIAANQN
ncbi:MAG TPA: DUF4164 family protein [Xanthobacteraceae bacterium]|nr:DUF4164 family protein [Xanthobacteraceae bacterium]